VTFLNVISLSLFLQFTIAIIHCELAQNYVMAMSQKSKKLRLHHDNFNFNKGSLILQDLIIARTFGFNHHLDYHINRMKKLIIHAYISLQ
jgi:hypothetical protein